MLRLQRLRAKSPAATLESESSKRLQRVSSPEAGRLRTVESIDSARSRLRRILVVLVNPA
jgi:hypothetical protein